MLETLYSYFNDDYDDDDDSTLCELFCCTKD